MFFQSFFEFPLFFLIKRICLLQRRPVPPPTSTPTKWKSSPGMKTEVTTPTVKVEDRGIASMSRLEYFQTMHTILLMEIEGLKVEEQMALKAKDTAAQDMRLALLMVESYEANLASHQEGDGLHPGSEAKRQVLAELLEDQKRALSQKESKALEKDLRE